MNVLHKAALDALKGYAAAIDRDPEFDIETLAADMIADLAHALDSLDSEERMGDSALVRAMSYYAEEVRIAEEYAAEKSGEEAVEESCNCSNPYCQV